MEKKRALIIVDVQVDFLPGGALAVPKANEIVPLINHLISLPFDHIVATRDFHPPKHYSFASRWAKKAGERITIEGVEQILWPEHCVQGTKGSEFAPGLDVEHFDEVVYKGVNYQIDSYSTFFDNFKLRTTGLEDFLRLQGVEELYFAGIATDYCVFYSVIDAVELGFTPFVIVDACRGIDLQPGDIQEALKKMQAKGAELVTSEQVEKSLTSHSTSKEHV